MASANAIDDVWDALDSNYEIVRDEVRELIVTEKVGEYPRLAGTIWLAYQLGNREEMLDEFLETNIEEAICWALQFETNHVLTGGALGALDGLPADRREAMALSIFDAMGAQNTRRFWLLMKVRTDAFVARVAEALESDYDPADRRKVVGGFRQFTAEDVPVLRKHYDPNRPGADLFIEALGATKSPQAMDIIAGAKSHSDPSVRETAARAMKLIKGQ